MAIILENILNNKKAEVDALSKEQRKGIIQNASKTKKSFKSAIKSPGISLIAEFKRRSPFGGEEGIINLEADPGEIAKIFLETNVDAISVVTDKYYGGALEDMETVAKVVKDSQIPILRKDFTRYQIQVPQTRVYGGDAMLLIVPILETEEIRDYINIAGYYKMDCVVEVHTELDVQRAKDAGAKMYGINTRDISGVDGKINTGAVEILRKKIPSGCPVIAMSGFTEYGEVKQLERLEVDAVLVGTSIMEAPNIKDKILELRGR